MNWEPFVAAIFPVIVAAGTYLKSMQDAKTRRDFSFREHEDQKDQSDKRREESSSEHEEISEKLEEIEKNISKIEKRNAKLFKEILEKLNSK